MANVTDEYVRHALQLIRVSNGLQGDANVRMRQLAIDLRRLLSGESLSTLGIGALRRIVAQADLLIFNAFDELHGAQSDAVANLVSLEAQWAVKIGQYDLMSTDASITRAINSLNVMGNTVQEHFDTVANRARNAIVSQIRQGAAASQTDKEILSRILGGADGRGGVMETARASVRGIVDSSAQAAADAGRRTAMKANDVTALQWNAKLDAKVCPSCGERDGMVWTIDGEPVNTGIPYAPVPLHPWCRCLLIPMEMPQDAMDELPESSTFSEWLNEQPVEDQNSILGDGRADLWRDGKITTSDLIGQNGLVMSLSDLEASLTE